jgi:hypothetical protein
MIASTRAASELRARSIAANNREIDDASVASAGAIADARPRLSHQEMGRGHRDVNGPERRAFAYDLGTGSRVGTERALIMTLIVLSAVIVDRRALTMRNLALATLVVVALEPEAVLGVSFQLSFAAVGALIVVLESRLDRAKRDDDPGPASANARNAVGGLARSLGAGIKFIIWAARHIAAAPGSSLYLRAFAPYPLPFLSLAVVSLLIWRSWLLRATVIPLAAIGLVGAMNGPRYDVIVPPDGGQAAIRDADGNIAILGKRFNAYAAEQWLAADGDGRQADGARDEKAPCDRLGCAETLPQGQAVALIEDRLAFDEDCRRAVVVVTRLTAPHGCRAAVVLDDRRLAETGAVGLTIDEAGTIAMATDRSVGEDRPWSPAPKRPRDDRIERPGATDVIHADPADPSIEPADPR